jgi:hypothetical protein
VHRIKEIFAEVRRRSGFSDQHFRAAFAAQLGIPDARLEQRKGRIQRIGQINDIIDILNLRCRGSVEDRVHALLSTRLKDIHELFGQLPDVLEDAWVDVATGNLERAHQRINAVPVRHPFELRYREPKPIDWESCTRVLARDVKQEALRRSWKG